MKQPKQFTKLSSKGQVILPKPIRDRLALKEGMGLAVSTQGRAILLEPLEKRSTWRRWRGALKGAGALAELEREHRREVQDDDRRP